MNRSVGVAEVSDAGEVSDAPPVEPARRGADDLVERWPAARPFGVIGSLCIVAGGLVAAVTRPTGFALGSWLAAFLVLIAGVAQIALGAGQAWLARDVPRTGDIAAEVTAWNGAAALTITGSLLALPIITTLGGVAFVVALGLFLRGVRTSLPEPRWVALLYRGVIVVVLISTPVGLVLAWMRHA